MTATHPTPAELLESSPVLTINDVAVILKFKRRGGKPDRRPVFELIKDDRLAIIDPRTPIQRWRVSNAEVRRYIGAEERGPRSAG